MDDLVIKVSANDSLEVFTERTNQVTKFQVNRGFGFALKEVLRFNNIKARPQKEFICNIFYN